MAKKFVTMQGLGNTFIVCQGDSEPTSGSVETNCRKHKVDGYLLISPIDRQSFRMRYWNADGSKAEMCGNGLRCAVRFAIDNELVASGTIVVKTEAGQREAKWDGKDSDIEVQVGKAKLQNNPIRLGGRDYFEVNVGNPHAVTYVENIDSVPVASIGPQVEYDKHFPQRTNVEFIHILSPSNIQMRVWERGVGETKACGTGMVASVCAALDHERILLPVNVKVPGGEAKIWQDTSGYFRIIAPAEYVT